MDLSQPSHIAETLARARAGEDAARQELFESCRSYLALAARAQVETWLRAKVDSSDLVQQTMLEAYRDFDRFTGATQGEWLAWLKQILRRNAADFIRAYRGVEKRDVRREVRFRSARDSTCAPGAPEPAAVAETPSQMLIRQDYQLQVMSALAELPDDYREVIVLRNLERLPFDEVAARLKRSRPAAQMLWMRAMRKLQAALGADTADSPAAPERDSLC